MKKVDKLIQEVKKEKEFVKAYVSLEEVWLLLKEVTVDSTKKYNDLKRKYKIVENILIIESSNENMLKEDLGEKLPLYKVIYK